MPTKRAGWRSVPDLVLCAVAAVAALAIAPAVPTYWDSFGYVAQALSGEIGGLGLGRPLFVLMSHAIARAWLWAGGSPWHLEPVLRAWWTAVSCSAAPLTRRLSIRAGLSDRAAMLAGLAVAASPAMAHAGGAVLTDGPATAAGLLACLFAARAVEADAGPQVATRRAAAAGLAMGVAIGLREQLVLQAAVVILLILAAPRAVRARLVAAVAVTSTLAVGAPILYALRVQPGYLATVRGWLAGMAHDRALRTYGWHDVLVLGGWLLSLGPFVVLAAAMELVRRRSPVWRLGTVRGAIVVPSLAQLAWMATFQGTAYSPRYFLPAFPAALALPGAERLAAWTRASRGRFALAVCAVVVPALVAIPIVRARAAPLEALLRDWPSRLMTVPANSLIVSGQPCPAIPMVRRIVEADATRAVAAPDWQAVCPGWAWPGDLTARLDEAVRAGRPVVLDLRPAGWVGAEQQAARREADAYARSRPWLQARGDLIVWR